MATTLHPGVPSLTLLDPREQLSALLTGAGIAPLDQTAWIRVTGDDRVRWLNGMVTNSIQTLAPGEGNYNFVLNAQGRIQADLTAWMLEDSILLETSLNQVENLITLLDRFIIMDDVELADISDQRSGLLLAGPHASALLAAVDLTTESLDPIELAHVRWHSASIELIHAHSPLIPRFELWADPAIVSVVRDQLLVAGAISTTLKALESLRILEGTPRYGTDIRNTETARDLPQETAAVGVPSRALHFSKGCYLGQEIVERIHSRGAVHRTFTGFQLTGALPPSGTTLESEGKTVGELTSVATIPLTNPIQLALGYIRREALPNPAQARNLPLTYPGGTATPITLPYPAFTDH